MKVNGNNFCVPNDYVWGQPIEGDGAIGRGASRQTREILVPQNTRDFHVDSCGCTLSRCLSAAVGGETRSRCAAGDPGRAQAHGVINNHRIGRTCTVSADRCAVCSNHWYYRLDMPGQDSRAYRRHFGYGARVPGKSITLRHGDTRIAARVGRPAVPTTSRSSSSVDLKVSAPSACSTSMRTEPARLNAADD